MSLLGRDYSRESFSHGAITHDVYVRGSGPGVVLLHELPGLAEPTVRLAERLVEAGYTVALPHLFGVIPGDHGPKWLVTIERDLFDAANVATLCVSREFARLQGGVTAPITDWLRALTKWLSDRTGGKPVCAIGMCLTGGYVIALVIDPWVAAAVTAQPAVPLTFLPGAHDVDDQLSVSEAELQQAASRAMAGDVLLLGFRFGGDQVCPHARFKRIESAFGARFEPHELPSPDPAQGVGQKAHSVLTYEYERAPAGDDAHPSRLANKRLLEFLEARLGQS